MPSSIGKKIWASPPIQKPDPLTTSILLLLLVTSLTATTSNIEVSKKSFIVCWSPTGIGCKSLSFHQLMTGFACLTLLSTLPTVAMAANSCEVLKQTSKGESQDQPPPSTCAHAERRALNFQVIWLSQPDTLGERNWKLSIDQISIQPIVTVMSIQLLIL